MDNDVRQIVDKWEDAFRKVNQKEPPTIEYVRGWIRFANTGQKVRKKQLIEMTETLLQRVNS